MVLTQKLTPFFMWAGGKTKMLPKYDGLIPEFVESYVEPFFGGGAVFCHYFNRNPDASFTINDINSELIGVLKAVKEAPEEFVHAVNGFISAFLPLDKPDRKALYYKLRERYWATQDPALLYFLMRTGFNGVWQTMKRANGLYATPAGLLNQSKPEQILNPELIRLWSRALQKTTILCGDFSEVPMGEGDYVFADPPYRHSFTNYEQPFPDTALKKLADKLTASGSTFALTNRTMDGDVFLETLFPEGTVDLHTFDITYTAGRRKKSKEGFQAKKAKEVLITNFR